MKNSKFIEAYLNIIKEETEGFEPTMGTETVPETSPVNAGEGAQVVCFKTTDKNLIDAINSGFDEVVFFVKAKDETTGEDTVAEVKFGPEAFMDIEVKAAEAGEEGTCPDCGAEGGECECEDTGDGGSVEGEDTGDSGGAEDAGTVTGDDTGDTINEEPENIDPSEWLEDGVCVKCGSAECDGTCKCKKCGSQNCIGDCEGDTEEKPVQNECGDPDSGSVESSDSI